jgi:hypothetical protein
MSAKMPKGQGIVTSVLLIAGLSAASLCHSEQYITWEGSEPDKAATAWLITRFIDPLATFLQVPSGTIVTDGIGFDIPGAKWRRSSLQTTFYTVLLDTGLGSDRALQQINSYIHLLEFKKWARPTDAPILQFESGMARLREPYGATIPPFDAFFEYFDDVYQTELNLQALRTSHHE